MGFAKKRNSKTGKEVKNSKRLKKIERKGLTGIRASEPNGRLCKGKAREEERHQLCL